MTGSNKKVLYITASTDEINRVYNTLSQKLDFVTVTGEVDGNAVLSVSSFSGSKRVRKWLAPRIANPGERKPTRYAVLLALYALMVFQLIFTKAIICDVALCQSAIDVVLIMPFHKLRIVRRVVLYTGDYFPSAERQRGLESFMVRISDIVDRLAWRESDSIWCYTDILKERITGAMRDTLKVVKVVDPLYFPAADGEVDMKDPAVVFVGSVRDDAGIDTALEALASLRTDSKPRLKVFGRPLKKETLDWIRQVARQRGVEDILAIRGLVPLAQLRAELQTALCGIAIFPGGDANYSNYGYPNKVKSYLENGIVALLGAHSALAQRQDMRESCLVVDETPEAVANAISFLLRNPNLANKMGAAAYNYAKRLEFSPDLFNGIEDEAKNR